DARSAGTVLTSGVGVVALRRLADALADGDPILAVIKGTAVNNDGQRKVGYLAPSVDGHADVVKEAFAVSGLSARNIQLLEAHGTGTAVGDPIEVAALTEAFRASTAETGFCRLVSTKPNIGHLDTAAGVASLIKVVQSLGHRTLPPLANHSAPSPLLDIEHTPFVLSGEAAPWPGDRPRRAGVSSLGVGGTNAHVIVQEPPSRPSTPAAAREQVLALSGRSADVLDDAARRLADHLEAHPDTNIADVAHTLATGRRAMAHRRVVTVTDTRSAVDVLRSQDRNRVATSVVPDDRQRVAFMFPGGGSQYNGMAAGLDARFGVFHDTMADGIARIERRSGIDLRPRLARDAAADALLHTTASLPAVFLTSIALARQWMAWGVTPTTFVGHSLGEYAAAHLAGVLTLDDAIELIVGRATLMDRASGIGAAMLAVPMPVARVRGLLAPTVSVAAINADDECVVAGPVDDIEALRAKLADDDVDATLIPLAAAAHSSLLDPILPDFLDIVRRVKLSAPRVPYVSNLTGTWITAEQAIDPHYWVDHLRHTVRFADGLATLLADGPMVLMELGPGQSLSSYARRQTIKPTAAIPALRHPNQEVDDTAYSLNAFARGWAVGLDLDLDRFSGTGRRLLRLPTYPFRKERYWIEPGAGRVAPVVEAPVTAPVQTAPVPERITDLADSFWSPVWTERPRIAPAVAPVGPWLVVGDPGDPFVVALARELTACGDVVDVTTAPGPAALTVARSVILVGPTGSFDGAVERWLTTASAAARALGDVDGTPTLLAAITRGATDAGGTAVAPIDAMALGIIGTAPREYVGLRTLHLDLDPTGDPLADAAAVVAEVLEGADRIVARRGLRRLVPSTERTRLDPPPTNAMTWRRGGNYLVTGGLGGVGFAIAEHLLRVHDANVAVVATRPVPAGVARTTWLAHHGYDDPMCRRIRRLAVLESIGPKVTVVAADIADPESVRAALAEAERHVGRLDGVIHAAGELRDRPIELATHEDHEDVVGAKARGALALIDELRRRGTEQLVLVSSTSTILLPEAQAAYVAANGVLDALAGTRGSLRITTINYGLWAELGVAADMARRARLGLEPGTPVEHPVLTELSVERDGTIRVVGTLTTDHHWLVAEHRTAAGVALLPGTGHLELFVAAARAAGIADAALAGVTLVDPLVVPDGVAVTTRVSITSGPDGRWAQVESDGG
ncbi:MAG: SDR family NAD(P)-dependent oxidoreductase, partial [Ilumatobacteraceae bacterium]